MDYYMSYMLGTKLTFFTGLDMETYEYVPCEADFDVLPIVVEEGSSDGVDPEESVPPHPLLSDADEAIEVANVMALDNPDGGIVGGAECDAEGKNEEVGEAESEEKSDVAGPSRMKKRRLTKRGPKNEKKKFNFVKDFQKYCSASDLNSRYRLSH
ncbi:hypothetical protein DAPPUDRAFT_274115 [Daphnia pulex]|uniref:Uncharacterized protein n=1 Tax=Daphnia pulex TaxID=6669 RepID=E9I3W4_DAPPU|nr:hypothetical protein DAPPUDRAFT_274115 [Daphnia pulex]|eukprot:EFX61316.1 hypothetical protein DAPPUDRAFT_274115 [Daphnia pulex]